MPGHSRVGRQQEFDNACAIRVNQFLDLFNTHRQKSGRQTESSRFLAPPCFLG